MHNLLRYIRQNRRKIIRIMLFIVFIYCIIKTTDRAYENQIDAQTSTKNQVEQDELQTDGTVKLSNQNMKSIIEEFLESATKGDYEKAYTYISQECKEKKYKTLEDFENNYCIENSIKGKGYNIEMVKNAKYTYEIQFNDMLSTGGTNPKIDKQIYTITVDNGHDIKINIDFVSLEKGG